MLTERSAMKSHVKRSGAAGVCLAVFIGLLAVGSLFTGRTESVIRNVQAQGDNSVADAHARVFPCSTATLTGRYALKGEGLVPAGPPPAPLVPFAAVNLETLDGQGQLTENATVSLNGVVASNFNLGSYTVDEDCTGTLTVNIPAPPFQVNHKLVVVDNGNGFYLIGTKNSVLTFTAKRVD